MTAQSISLILTATLALSLSVSASAEKPDELGEPKPAAVDCVQTLESTVTVASPSQALELMPLPSAESKAVVVVNASPEVAASLPVQTLRQRPDEIAQAILQILAEKGASSGSLAAVALLESTLHPTLEAVATFLQTRSNYPKIFDRNELADAATMAFDQLSAALDRLKEMQSRQVVRPWWKFWVPRQSGEVVSTTRLVRVYHHGIKASTEALKENTESIRKILETTQNLRLLVIQGVDLSREIQAILESQKLADPSLQNALEINVLRRLISVSNDLIAQMALVDGLTASLEQRIQLNSVMQDRVRSLTTVVLPMVAMMGQVELDLSPLQPGETAEALPAPSESGSTEGADSSGAPGRKMTVREVISMASASNTHGAHNSILKKYFDAYLGNLTVAEAVALAESSTDQNVHNSFLQRYVNKHAANMTTRDAIKLANTSTTHNTHNYVLIYFARSRARDLTPKDLKDIAGASTTGSAESEILGLLSL